MDLTPKAIKIYLGVRLDAFVVFQLKTAIWNKLWCQLLKRGAEEVKTKTET